MTEETQDNAAPADAIPSPSPASDAGKPRRRRRASSPGTSGEASSPAAPASDANCHACGAGFDKPKDAPAGATFVCPNCKAFTPGIERKRG